MKYLIRIFVFSLLISLWLPIFSVNAQQEMENGPVWLSASGQKSSNLSNKQQVNSLSENTLDVLITFPGVWAEMQNENGVDFTRIWQDEYSSYREPGQPVLPGKAYNILIPYGAQVEILNQTVTSEKIKLSDYSLPATITPAQIQVSKSETPPPWTEPDPQHYSSPNTFPQNWYELQSTFQIRDYTILPLWINPVRYSPGKGEIEILEQIELRLTWQTSSVDGTRNAVVSDSPSFDRLVRQLVINPPELPVYNTKAETGEGYLIITPDEFEDALRPFVDMKENQGYEVSLTKLSEIDTIYDDHSVTSIQNYIKSIVPPPVYLLLVGDTNLIPGFNLTNYSGFAYSFDKTTDLYYGTLDDDFIPDIAVGRLPVRNIGDLTTVINKISSYNYMGFQRWQSNTSFIASCDYYAITEESHNDVMEKRTSPLGYPTFFPVNQDLTGGDHLYCYTFSARTNDILNSINNKRGIITYSGHGNFTSWIENNKYTISLNELQGLVNTNAYSFVASFACYTNDFGNSTIESVFSEVWMLLENKGAIAFLGSADESIWGPDDLFERKLFEILFRDPYNPPPLKLAVNEALKLISYPKAGIGTEQYYWETYNLLGDPSQKLWLVPSNRVFMPVIFK